MGFARENGGYSAQIEGFLVVADQRYRLAKTNAVEIYLADECELSPGTRGELLIIVDGDHDTSPIELPDGITRGQRCVRYADVSPF